MVVDDIEDHPTFGETGPVFLPQSFIPTVSNTNIGCPRRVRKLPKQYLNLYPEGPAPLPAPVPAPKPAHVIPRVILHVKDTICTTLNRFHLMHEYPHHPSYYPDGQLSSKELSNINLHVADFPLKPGNLNLSHPPPWPFTNMSVYRLMQWFNSGSHQKSAGETERLVREIICADDFDARDLAGFNIRSQSKKLDTSEGQAPHSGDGWEESSVDIHLPTGIKGSESGQKTFTIFGLHRRSLLSILKSAIIDPSTASCLHFSPFKQFWVKPSGVRVRCIDKVYTSDAHINAHNELQKQVNEPGCTLEKVILALMFWSDSTQLVNFGTTKVWPLYLFLGNLSKYFCGKPGSGACHHVAYFPLVCSGNYLLDLGSLILAFSFPIVHKTLYQTHVLPAKKAPSLLIVAVSSCSKYGKLF